MKERAVSAASLVLKAAGNLMDAVSRELVGVMETHVTQNDHSDAIN